MSAVAQLLTAVLLAMIAFTIVVLTIESQNKHAAIRQEITEAMTGRASCLGSGERTIYQLQIDFDVYRADYQTAHSAVTTSSQRQVRGSEASSLLDRMKLIAGDRIRFWDAYEVPEPLSGIIRKAHFSCVAAYPLPPGGKLPPPIPSYPKGPPHDH